MGIFSRRKRQPDPVPRESAVPATDRTKMLDTPRPLWTDLMGRTAIRAAQLILIVVVATAAVYVGIQLKIVVIPLLLALILASALHPLVDWMSDKGLPRVLATVITLIAGLGLLGGIITLVVNGVQNEWDNLSSAVSDAIDEVTAYLQSGNLPFDPEQIEEARVAIVDFFTSAEFGSTALAGATTVVELLTSTVLLVVVLFFFLKDGPKMVEFLLTPLRGHRKERARFVGVRANKVLGGYLVGTATVALVDTTFIGLALWILGVPLALPLSLLVFVGAFIPIVGATLAGTIAALVALVTNDLGTAIIVAIVVIAVNQLEGNLLAPFVLGNAIKLHALVVLLALSAGTILGGIVGTFLGVPIAAVAWAIIKAWSEYDHPERMQVPAEPKPKRRKRVARA